MRATSLENSEAKTRASSRSVLPGMRASPFFFVQSVRSKFRMRVALVWIASGVKEGLG